MAEILVIILATIGAISSTLAVFLLPTSLPYHVLHVSISFTSSVAEGRHHEVFYSMYVKDQLSLVVSFYAPKHNIITNK